MINKVILTGRLVADVELALVISKIKMGSEKATFSL